MYYLAQNDNYCSMQHILNTYKAFAEAIIPWTPNLEKIYGNMQFYGAMDFFTYEYLILSLYDIGGVSLIKSVADALDAAAVEMISNETRELLPDFSKGATFEVLAPKDRLAVLHYMKEKETLEGFEEYQTEESVVRFLADLTMMGYYSEWFGYGCSRLNEANDRNIEFKPLSWDQISYPGSYSLNKKF